MYDPHSDLGLRLYSPSRNCYLATSWRTYPDYDGTRTNDTLQDALDLELEATCTSDVADDASRLWVIEGILDASEITQPPSKMYTLWQWSLSHLQYGSELWRASRDSRGFRLKFPHLQDTPTVLQHLSTGVGNSSGLFPQDILCLVATIAMLARLVWLQRLPSQADRGKCKSMEKGVDSTVWAGTPCKVTPESPPFSHTPAQMWQHLPELTYCGWHSLNVALFRQSPSSNSVFPTFMASLSLVNVLEATYTTTPNLPRS